MKSASTSWRGRVLDPPVIVWQPIVPRWSDKLWRIPVLLSGDFIAMQIFDNPVPALSPVVRLVAAVCCNAAWRPFPLIWSSFPRHEDEQQVSEERECSPS